MHMHLAGALLLKLILCILPLLAGTTNHTYTSIATKFMTILTLYLTIPALQIQYMMPPLKLNLID